ncbi:hypothetical protein PPL_09187 [Heterostelium album PN500]|uniref:EGF-like domain-containing protein n=1 Tax=Heterostelium pallidum (strain ATCC 26659 / Pp 5 / PN500) TaxID=670386 RepID=D3BKV5_HETP5|nr:hypothetical protein PPL_09187 [Heterostelium album PN500]EFA78535.1 hypothetical protein PPL_09187 [Heterostelium album PN500]|eukprot:XP_020430659.1 hypothetical protein PPL_09187 [Heterostelium album PN500]
MILHTILLVVISIATINGMSIASVKQEINEKFNANSVTQCTLNIIFTTCKPTPTGYTCPSIADCITAFSRQAQPTQSYQVLIPAGSYGQSDCPGNVGAPPLSGSLSFIGYGGLVEFQCKSTQFISIDSGDNPLNILFDSLSISGSATYNGGSIEILGNSTSPLYSNLYLLNVTGNGSYAGDYGGFASCSFARVYVINSTFVGNIAQAGGGVVFAPFGLLISLQSNYYNNSIYRTNGGAIYSSTANLINSTFTGNYAYNGGAVASIYSMDAVNSSFTKNRCSYVGGALYALSGIKVYGSTFQSNNGYYGGAIYGVNMTIDVSSFKGNQALNGGVGGAVYVAGENPGQIAISNTTFNQNSADGSGGAIYTIETSLYLINCVFKNNSANHGGGIFVSYRSSDYTEVNIISSILTDNTAVSNGGAINMFESSYGPLLVNFYKSVFDRNTAGNYAGGAYFLQYPKQLLGGVFTNSVSSETDSYTFYSESIQGVNTANITIPSEQNPYYVTVFDEQSFSYYKAIGVTGSCFNGVAKINENGYILSCSCFAGSTGPSCDN